MIIIISRPAFRPRLLCTIIKVFCFSTTAAAKPKRRKNNSGQGVTVCSLFFLLVFLFGQLHQITVTSTAFFTAPAISQLPFTLAATAALKVLPGVRFLGVV